MRWEESTFLADGFVEAFILEKLAYLPKATPDGPDKYVNHWKYWLWLESKGYDFADCPAHILISSFIFELGEGGVVSDDLERRLILKVRNVMREILALPQLRESAELLAPVSEEAKKHSFGFPWAYGLDVAAMYAIPKDACSLEELRKLHGTMMDHVLAHAGENLKICAEALRLAKAGHVDVFEDDVTDLGHLELHHGTRSSDLVYSTTMSRYVTAAVCTATPPCNYGVLADSCKEFDALLKECLIAGY